MRWTDDMPPVDWHKRDEFIDLLEEVERLRRALEEIASNPCTADDPCRCKHVATEALDA